MVGCCGASVQLLLEGGVVGEDVVKAALEQHLPVLGLRVHGVWDWGRKVWLPQ